MGPWHQAEEPGCVRRSSREASGKQAGPWECQGPTQPAGPRLMPARRAGLPHRLPPPLLFLLHHGCRVGVGHSTCGAALPSASCCGAGPEGEGSCHPASEPPPTSPASWAGPPPGDRGGRRILHWECPNKVAAVAVDGHTSPGCSTPGLLGSGLPSLGRVETGARGCGLGARFPAAGRPVVPWPPARP